jgi:hypothetical protein
VTEFYYTDRFTVFEYRYINKGKSWMDLTMMKRVGDRKKWKDLVREAKAHSGL